MTESVSVIVRVRVRVFVNMRGRRLFVNVSDVFNDQHGALPFISAAVSGWKL